MCLILWANDYHSKYKLVVAANRDEFYSRPTLPASFWPENPSILAGQDLKAGGTWMGITTRGRFATLTNYRDPKNINPHAPSRGKLVQKYLESSLPTEEYMQNLLLEGGKFNGFNLLAGTWADLYYFSNREMLVQKVEKGVHGLSNSLIDVPWPKVSKGIQAMKQCLKAPEPDIKRLFDMMLDREMPDDSELPSTGVGIELERMLAPLFVESKDYGTRTTSVLLIDNNNYTRFWERSFNPMQHDSFSERYFEFFTEPNSGSITGGG